MRLTALIVYALYLFSIAPAFAWNIAVVGGGVPGVCTTPQDGSELNEGFLGTGYEDTWSESVGSGTTLDEDFTLSGSPLSGSCSEGLNAIVPTSNGNETYSEHWFASDLTFPSDIYAEIYIDSVTLSSSDYFVIMMMANNAVDSIAFTVALYNVAGTLSITATDNDLSSYSTPVSISLDTWHTIRIHLDATAADSYLKLNSGTSNTFERNDYARRLYIGAPYWMDTDEAVDIEFGRVWVDTP